MCRDVGIPRPRAASCFEQIVEVSTTTSRDFLRVLDRQFRINGEPLAATLQQTHASARESRAHR